MYIHTNVKCSSSLKELIQVFDFVSRALQRQCITFSATRLSCKFMPYLNKWPTLKTINNLVVPVFIHSQLHSFLLSKSIHWKLYRYFCHYLLVFCLSWNMNQYRLQHDGAVCHEGITSSENDEAINTADEMAQSPNKLANELTAKTEVSYCLLNKIQSEKRRWTIIWWLIVEIQTSNKTIIHLLHRIQYACVWVRVCIVFAQYNSPHLRTTDVLILKR